MHDPLPFNSTPRPVRLRMEDYLLLDASGAFQAYAKTELIGGEIVGMNAQHRPHAVVKTRLLLALVEELRAAPAGLVPLVEASIAMPPHNVPEPDILVTSEPDGEGLVPLASVALVIEVADTTVAHDLSCKAALYAEAGIPEYWVTDVRDRAIVQLWKPSGAGYAESRIHGFGTTIAWAANDGLMVLTDAL